MKHNSLYYRFVDFCFLLIISVGIFSNFSSPVDYEEVKEKSGSIQPIDQTVQVIPDVLKYKRPLEEIENEPREEEQEETLDLSDANLISDCTVTWYTADTCGKKPGHPLYGITFSGLPVEDGVTCAVDQKIIPLHSKVYVEYSDGTIGEFIAQDTGVKGEWIDIYTSDYDYAIQCGKQKLNVYWIENEGGNDNEQD